MGLCKECRKVTSLFCYKHRVSDAIGSLNTNPLPSYPTTPSPAVDSIQHKASSASALNGLPFATVSLPLDATPAICSTMVEAS